MRRMLVLLIALLFAQGFAKAAGQISFCKTVDADGRLHFHLDDPSGPGLPNDYMLTHISDGPGIEINYVLTGAVDWYIDVMLPNADDSVTFFMYPEEVSVTVGSKTDAADCGGNATEPMTLDDQGNVNNPLVNERANTCYGPGQVCTTEAEWEAGWYLIRQQYGVP